MLNLQGLFGQSPFGPLVEHARKVHECVRLLRPVADAVLAGDTGQVEQLQHKMSETEYEADQIKDTVRKNLPTRYFLPVNREDVARFLAQLDKMADDAEDFAVVATLRPLRLPDGLHPDFLGLVDKVIEVGDSVLKLAEQLATLQKESFSGPDTDKILAQVQQVAHGEWESDKLSRKFARRYYTAADIDPIAILLLDKLCAALGGVADHAENVGKSLRLMIMRK